MTTIRVADSADERLRVFASLTNHQLRNRLDPARGLLVAESQIAIRVALEEGVEPVAFLLDERRLEVMDDVLRTISSEVPVYVLAPEEAQRLTGYRVTRGALCAMRRPKPPRLGELLSKARHVVVCEGMTDAANVGATFRNAAALGADAVVVAPNCADPLCRRAVRVSMGNVFRVPWVQTTTPWPGVLMEELRDAGFRSIALALKDDAVPLAKVRSALGAEDKVALFLGAEGSGLAQKTIEACDKCVIIPMSRGVDSLNVAAAGAVALWELFAKDAVAR